MQSENKLKQKEQEIRLKIEEFQKKHNEFNQARENLNKQLELLAQRQAEVEKTFQTSVQKLEQIAGLSAQEAKQQLIEAMTQEARNESMNRIMEIVEEAKLPQTNKLKKLLSSLFKGLLQKMLSRIQYLYLT